MNDKAGLYASTPAKSKYLQKNIFTPLFPSGRSPQSLSGQVCVHQCVCASYCWKVLCAISFRQETGNGPEAITV